MPRGRPVSFDKAATLEKTLHVFWTSGYLGASYTDLCNATGLTKPSLYGAFGNKEETFLAALDLYLERFVRPGVALLASEPDPREGVRKLLIATAAGLTADRTPPGCMIAANIACATAADVPRAVSDALLSAVKETPKAIARALSQAPSAHLPPETTPETLATFFEAVIAGLSGMARQGSTRAELLSVIDRSMRCW